MAVGPKFFQLAFTKTRNECGTSFTWLFHPKIVHKIWTIKKSDADIVQYGAAPPSLTTLCERFYVDRNAFGFVRDATDLMKKCLKFGYKYYRGKEIEGV